MRFAHQMPNSPSTQHSPEPGLNLATDRTMLQSSYGPLTYMHTESQGDGRAANSSLAPQAQSAPQFAKIGILALGSPAVETGSSFTHGE
jgi:hypothetical protein